MTAPTPTLALTHLPGRCPTCAFHIATQGCRCESGEWKTFTAAIRAAVRDDGSVHQSDVRPRIRGRIEPKHIGQLWRRARNENLIAEVGHERSDDHAGRNAGRMEPVYALGRAA